MKSAVRTLEDRDQAAVVALSLRAWAPVFASLEQVLGESGAYAQLHPDWRVAQRRVVESALNTEAIHIWVAEAEDAVAGFAAAQLDRDESIGEIYLLAVDPAHQRKGVGASLMSFALRWIKDNGMVLAMVETGGDPGHSPARHTYQRAGFTELPVSRYFKKL